MDAIDARLQAMLAVSEAIVTGSGLKTTLDEIARQACTVANADSAAILELTGEKRFRIVGSHGLSAEYYEMLAAWPAPLMPGRGPSGLAVEQGRPIVVADFQNDPRFAEWAAMPLREGWRALAVFPLIVGDAVLGTLVLYRTQRIEWSPDEITLLGFVAEHAAVAVRTAQLMDEQQRQVAALERLVRRLREQAHEHANRLHAVGGLLSLGESEEALEFIEGLTSKTLVDRRVLGTGPPTALTGLLAVEASLADQRAIRLDVVAADPLDATALSEAQAVTIVGNLLDNAFEAVADQPPQRRRVEVSITVGDRAELRVRDWGHGLAVPDPFVRGVTSKAGHLGAGLALVREAATAAYGDVRAERLDDGTSFVVTLPRRAATRAPLHVLQGVDAVRRNDPFTSGDHNRARSTRPI